MEPKLFKQPVIIMFKNPNYFASTLYALLIFLTIVNLRIFLSRQELIEKVNLASVCGQTLLPDRSLLIGQNFKILKFKSDILGHFQTL